MVQSAGNNGGYSHECLKEEELLGLLEGESKILGEIDSLKASHDRRVDRELAFAAEQKKTRDELRELQRRVGHPMENGEQPDGLYLAFADLANAVIEQKQSCYVSRASRPNSDHPEEEGVITQVQSRSDLVVRAHSAEAASTAAEAASVAAKDLSGRSHRRASQAVWIAIITSLVSFATLGERLIETWLVTKHPNSTNVHPVELRK